jgi:hypothetical protein
MYFAQNALAENCTQSIVLSPLEGSGISAAREWLVKEALKKEATHILFIDQDMGFANKALHILAQRRLPIIGCNYPKTVKDAGFTAPLLDRKTLHKVTTDKTGVEEVFYTGFGFCLIEADVFRNLPHPWFLIGYNRATEKYSTEDYAFACCLERNKFQLKWHVDNDASKLVWHVGSYNYSWEDYQDGR